MSKRIARYKKSCKINFTKLTGIYEDLIDDNGGFLVSHNLGRALDREVLKYRFGEIRHSQISTYNLIKKQEASNLEQKIDDFVTMLIDQGLLDV
jgi:hypothetical protein